jgi:Flp pilus assembly protein TadD
MIDTSSSGSDGRRLEALEAAAASQPRDAATLMQLGVAYLEARRPEEAETAFRAAARLVRDSPGPGLGIAASLAARGRSADAVAQLRKLLQAFPSSADAWFNLGNFLRKDLQFDEAARCFRRVLALRPADEAACLNLGIALTLGGRFDEAEAALREFVALHGESADLLCNLGQALRYARRYDEAAQALRRAATLSAGHVGAAFNLALATSSLGDARSAEAMLRELLLREPAYAEAHAHLAELLLGTGRYAEGWSEYRWRDVHIEREAGRWTRQDPGAGPRSVADLRGAHVVVRDEQGLGDVLFFLRFADELARVATTVTLDVEPRLREIIGDRPQFGWSPPEGETLVEVLAGSLPAALGVTGTAPAFALAADPERVRRARGLLERAGPPPYVGATWEAGTRMRDSRKPGAELHKRVDPAALAGALAGLPGTVVSLQRNPAPDDLSRFRAALGRPAADLADANKDLPLLLAVLSSLDRYVGVSNTNMHLLAGLGRSAEVLVPVPPEWRWMRQGSESPWFPGFRVYREGADLSWTPALGRLKETLRSGLPQ